MLRQIDDYMPQIFEFEKELAAATAASAASVTKRQEARRDFFGEVEAIKAVMETMKTNIAVLDQKQNDALSDGNGGKRASHPNLCHLTLNDCWPLGDRGKT